MKRQRHHYIPRFYLESWAHSEGKVFEYSLGRKNEIRVRLVTPKRTGFVWDLYKIEVLAGDYAYDVEKKFMGMVDSRAAIVFQKILSSQMWGLSSEERVEFANLIFSLVIRNPQELGLFKKQFSRDWDKKIPDIEERYKATLWRPGYPDSFSEYEKIVAPDYWKVAVYEVFCNLIQDENFSRLLSSMHWGVRELSVRGKQLLTSDRPVIMTNGLMGESAHVLLPISPDKLFFCSPSARVVECLYDLSDRLLLRDLNRKIMRQALSYVYSARQFDSKVIKKYFAKADYEPFVRRTLGLVQRPPH
ncbi:DUF4238 domain-containing protein [Amorphus orientalis]|uniref:DUF4238 domain-containing protein n=1 Tax=Amorphus orientalis TaxID=649198 RepID=A0AAE4ASG6_9HYPH|nr:DUF4238 domain-containing protein [Amorphus orientalis]MDQ0313949.1 hypothetical protein [Amorphus orientalis]